MRKVELIKGIASSALGFGCAPILGYVDGKKAKRALECSLENGINHFDLARSYGYGEAENFVGNFLRNKRQQVVIASKFGIKANWRAKILQPVKPAIRFAMETIKKSQKDRVVTVTEATKSVANNFHYRILFNEKQLRKSLEETLKALHTDYLDYFFIHEPPEYLYLIDELCSAAEKLKSQGKIRGWGLAYTRQQEKLHSSYLSKFDILQFNFSIGTPDYNDVMMKRGKEPNIFFSALSGGSKEISAEEKLKQLFKDFPSSVILCSMFNENHIRNNCSLV